MEYLIPLVLVSAPLIAVACFLLQLQLTKHQHSLLTWEPYAAFAGTIGAIALVFAAASFSGSSGIGTWMGFLLLALGVASYAVLWRTVILPLRN